MTQLESMRRRFNQRSQSPEATGVKLKLTLTAIVVKMAASALKQFPKFNASLDLADDAIVYKKYVHIGVAVDTDRGLLVPVIRDVDRTSAEGKASSVQFLHFPLSDAQIKAFNEAANQVPRHFGRSKWGG